MRKHVTYLLLEVFTNLVIHFEFLFDLFQLLIVDITVLNGIFRRWNGWGEEVEERLSRLCLSDKTRAVCVYPY